MIMMGTKKQAKPRRFDCVVLARHLKRLKRLREKKGRPRKQGTHIHGSNPLPIELVNDILGRLSPRYLCVVRAVCREWDTLVRSRDFLSKYTIGDDGCGKRLDGPTLALVDLRCDKQSFVAFNVELKRWMHVPSFYEGPKVDTGCGMVACAKGLVVYNITPLPEPYLEETHKHFRWKIPTGRLQFVVRNPLLGTTKVLPPTIKHLEYAFTATQSTVMLEVFNGSGDLEVQGYKITVLYPFCVFEYRGFEGGEIYDSRVGYWVYFNITKWWVIRDIILPRSKQTSFYAKTRHIVFNGDMYCVAHPVKSTCEISDTTGRKVHILEHEHIIALDLENHNWRVVYNMEYETKVCPYYYEMTRNDSYKYGDPQLAVVCDKYLVFVVLGLPFDNENYYLKHPILGWMAFLDVKSNKVVHRTILSNNMAALLGRNSNLEYMVIGAGRYVCICNPENKVKMIAYDFSRKEWEEWPHCPFPLEIIRQNQNTWPCPSLGHNGVCGGKEASSLMDYQLSYLLV